MRKLKDTERSRSFTDGKIHQTEPHLRCNPHIHSGYRIGHTSPGLVLRSIFSYHNETLNIWSHLLPALMMSHWLYSSYGSIGGMLVAYTVACVFLFLCSSAYHLFKCQNEETYTLCLKLDFCGIVAVIAASFLAGIYYGFHCFPVIRNIFLAMTVLVNGFLLYVALSSRKKFSISTRRVFYVIGVAWCMIPMTAFINLYDLSTDAEALQMTKSSLILLLGYGVAFFLYATKIPERIWPGKFDNIGHSHQLWHVLIAACVVWWYWSLEQASAWAATAGNCPEFGRSLGEESTQE